jgi:DNA-binding XRE family transcriptional regulator
VTDIQIIRSPSGEELVVMPRAEYEALVAAAWVAEEDQDDVALYDARKAELGSGPGHVLPEAVSLLLLRGNSRLKAIRLWRKMSQTELADRAGIGQGYLSDLESGRRAGSNEVLQALATGLTVPVDWIMT